VQVISHHLHGDSSEAERLGGAMAEHLLASGARLILKAVYG
jgi:hypothetical protein